VKHSVHRAAREPRKGESLTMRTTALLCLLAGLLLFCAVGSVVSAEEKQTSLALTYGVFMPSNSDTKDVFGDSWQRFGLEVIRPEITTEWLRLIDISVLSRNDVGDVVLVPLNVGFEKKLAGGEDAQLYTILRAGPYYGKVEAPPDIDDSTLGLNANATLGVMFNKRFYIEARYDYFSRFAGFNFDGFTLSAGVRIYDFK